MSGRLLPVLAFLASCATTAPAAIVGLSIRPERPIAGDEVQVRVPLRTRPDCYFSPAVVAEGRTSFVVEAARESKTPTCPISQRHSTSADLVSLGALPAGDYRVRAGTLTRAFRVLPAGTDPGPLPDELMVRLGVARRHPPGSCFGMPGSARHESAEDRRRRTPTVWRQVERAYPDLDSDKRARLLDDAAFVDVELLGGAAWAYHFSDGHCCTIREVEGRAWLWPDGHVEVGPARIVSTRHVPC